MAEKLNIDIDANTKEPDTKDDHEEYWVYVGRRLGKANKTRYVWIDQTDSERSYKTAPKPATIGGVYQITLDSDDAMYISGTKGPRYICMADDEMAGYPEGQEYPFTIRTREEIFGWELADRTTQTYITQQSKANADRYDMLVGTLAPITLEYGKLPRHRRAAMLATVIEVITRGELP